MDDLLEIAINTAINMFCKRLNAFVLAEHRIQTVFTGFTARNMA